MIATKNKFIIFVNRILALLTLSVFASLFAYAHYAGLVFHEMHYVAAASLPPGLTLEQVAQDIFITLNIWALVCTAFVAFVSLFFLSLVWAQNPRVPKELFEELCARHSSAGSLS